MMSRTARAALALAVVGLIGATIVMASGRSAKFEPRILKEAKRSDAALYHQAQRAGARISATADKRSFYVLWPDRRPTGPVILTLHGFKSTAFSQFSRWLPYARARGYSILSLQWRLTRTESYSPQQMYGQARRVLEHEKVRRGTVLFHGFSSAAIRTYGVTALDRRGARLFGMTIADAGGAFMAFPMNRAVFGGAYGRRPLAGSHFVLFCGGRDPHPDYTGCPAMRRAGTLIRERGGRVEKLIRDPTAGHAGFHAHPRNVEAALAVFARLVPS